MLLKEEFERPVKKWARLPEREHFWSFVDLNGEDGCWIWHGERATGGYGRFSHRGRRWPAHRYAYEGLVALIPEGLHIDHLCRKPPCVNPAHLEPVTCRENLLRGDTFQARNAQKTHCPQGHPYDAANTYTPPGKNARHCRACSRDRARQLLATEEGRAAHAARQRMYRARKADS